MKKEKSYFEVECYPVNRVPRTFDIPIILGVQSKVSSHCRAVVFVLLVGSVLSYLSNLISIYRDKGSPFGLFSKLASLLTVINLMLLKNLSIFLRIT